MGTLGGIWNLDPVVKPFEPHAPSAFTQNFENFENFENGLNCKLSKIHVATRGALPPWKLVKVYPQSLKRCMVILSYSRIWKWCFWNFENGVFKISKTSFSNSDVASVVIGSERRVSQFRMHPFSSTAGSEVSEYSYVISSLVCVFYFN
jgi:hypothetical protein